MSNIFKKKLYKLLEQDSRLWDEGKKEFNEICPGKVKETGDFER